MHYPIKMMRFFCYLCLHFVVPSAVLMLPSFSDAICCSFQCVTNQFFRIFTGTVRDIKKRVITSNSTYFSPKHIKILGSQVQSPGRSLGTKFENTGYFILLQIYMNSLVFEFREQCVQQPSVKPKNIAPNKITSNSDHWLKSYGLEFAISEISY